MKKRYISFFLIFFLIIGCIYFYSDNNDNHNPDKPDNLKTELLDEAYGINTKNPSFSWIVNDQDNNEIQSAYRIMISSTSALLADVYDTGWIDSNKNSDVHIDELENILEDYELYYWQVQTKDRYGAKSELSQPAVFMTDISNQWLSTDGIWSKADESTNLNRFTFLRSSKLYVENIDEIDKAIISVSSRGTDEDNCSIFDLYFNGECIGAGSAREMSVSDDYTLVYYNSYDVTDLLVNGYENVISAIGNCKDEERGILIQMILFYKDDTKEIITNSSLEDSNWKALDGTMAFGDNGSGIDTGYVTILNENIDMTYYPEGWNETTYDDSSWNSASITTQIGQTDGTSGRVLTPYTSENSLRIETNESSKSIYLNENNNLVIDLGKEIIGGLKINIKSSANQEITVHMGEDIEDDGSVIYELTASPIYEDKWKLVLGTNSFETVTMRNFRYVEIIGLDDETIEYILSNGDSIKGWAIQQDFNENDSTFYVNDDSEEAELLNDLWDLCKYTIQATNQDLYVDSQARERVAYEGDLLVNASSSYAVSSNYSLARHSNQWLIYNETWPNDYCLFTIEVAYLDYLYTGNIQFLKENYDLLKQKLTDNIEYEDKNTGLIRGKDTQAGNGSIIDWPLSQRDDYEEGYFDVILNIEYAGIYQTMANISMILEHTDDASYYTEKSNLLKTTLIEKAYDNENGCFYDSLSEDYEPTLHSSMHASAYALAYQIYNNQDMADELCNFVYEKCKDEFSGSIYTTYFVLMGLYNANHGEYAYELLTNLNTSQDNSTIKTFASILYDLDCTITPEAWSTTDKSNMTYSHPWGSSPAYTISSGMFGITPTSAGFSTFDIKLQLGDIQEASYSLLCVKGNISISYENIDQLEITLSIPVNTEATIYIPVTDENIQYVYIDNNKTKVINDGDYVSITLGSGNYTITVN